MDNDKKDINTDVIAEYFIYYDMKYSEVYLFTLWTQSAKTA